MLVWFCSLTSSHVLISTFLQTLTMMTTMEKSTATETTTSPELTPHPHLYIIGLPLPSRLYVQEEYQTSNFLAFFVMSSNYPENVSIRVNISLQSDTHVTKVDTIDYQLTPATHDIVVHLTNHLGNLLMSPMEKAPKCVLVSSSQAIQVTLFMTKVTTASQRNVTSIAATQILPLELLSTTYVVVVKTLKRKLHVNNGVDYAITIISAMPNNQATISLQTSIKEKNEKPWLTFNGASLRMSEMTVALGQYEAFQLESKHSMKASRISLHRRAALFLFFKEDDFHDVEQMMPVSSRLTQYVTLHADMGRWGVYINRYRSVPLKDHTFIQVDRGEKEDGSLAYFERAGDYWRMTCSPGSLMASTPGKPFVSLFYKSSWEWLPYFSISLIPTAMWRNQYVWSMPASLPGLFSSQEQLANLTLKLSIVIEENLLTKLVFDGKEINLNNLAVSTRNYSFFDMTVSPGRHTIGLESPGAGEKFSAMLLGIIDNPDGSVVAFCHSLGLDTDVRDYLFDDIDQFPKSNNKVLVRYPIYIPKNATEYSTTYNPTSFPEDTWFPNSKATDPTSTAPDVVSTTNGLSASTEVTKDSSTSTQEVRTNSDVSTAFTNVIATNAVTTPPIANLTKADLRKIVKEIRRHLKVNKQKTSKALRRLVSSPDARMSSTSIGIVGICICALIVGLIVVSDLIKLAIYVMAKMQRPTTAY